MSIRYEEITQDNIHCVRDLCNELMAYQLSKATIRPELFDDMCFETRLIPSIQHANKNFLLAAKDGDKIVGYVYSNISDKETYDNDFATFFDMDSVENKEVGCLSQFYIKDGYRGIGIGGVLFDRSMEWLRSFSSVTDLFIFVSNGNDSALRFYQHKGFQISHQILDGFITVLRTDAQ